MSWKRVLSKSGDSDAEVAPRAKRLHVRWEAPCGGCLIRTKQRRLPSYQHLILIPLEQCWERMICVALASFRCWIYHLNLHACIAQLLFWVARAQARTIRACITSIALCPAEHRSPGITRACSELTLISCEACSVAVLHACHCRLARLRNHFAGSAAITRGLCQQCSLDRHTLDNWIE